MKRTIINGEITLREPEGGILFGTDALLLAYFIKNIKKGAAVELGSGSGVISFLLLSSGSGVDITGIEVQQEYFKASLTNAEENGFSDKFTPVLGDIRNIKKLYPPGAACAVFTNPPYLKTNSGKSNINTGKSIAFHEILCGIGEFCRAAGWCLKSGGKFYAVYRPERLAVLLSAMRAEKIEPKRLRAVFPSAEKKPSLFLVEGKKDAAEGLICEKNLYIYKNGIHTEYSAEMQEIYSLYGQDYK